ncbi:hypothetical protein J5X84_27515 [Streptosporangiaceae bacterium NEAU-GS5]|nr:hypothetical protein [Streptosporangiaceae bacterium NEAU-GS5]
MLLVVGDHRLYFSHLPMFSMPEHRFQVLLEVTLGEEVEEVLRTDAKTTGNDTYTFEPRRFPIVELDPADGGPVRTSMVGTIFRGHFERGGESIAEDVTARIQRVAHFRPLDPQAHHDNAGRLSYLCFGGAGDLFLAHKITARPDFDQVVRVHMAPGTVEHAPGTIVPSDVLASDFDLAVPVIISRVDTPAERLTENTTATALFDLPVTRSGEHSFTVQLRIDREIYLEIGELA